MMKHYARLDDNDVVIEIVELEENDDQSLIECDSRAVEGQLFDQDTGETIEGDALRKNYPNIGWQYNRELDLFEMPCAFDSWQLNPDTGCYEAPVDYPEDSTTYSWNEEAGEWQPVSITVY